MIPIGNLEGKSKISPAQFTLFLVIVCFGGQVVLTPQGIIDDAEHAAPFVVIASGFIYFFAAYMMLLLAKQFPNETLVEYMPRLWGKWLGILPLLILVVTLVGELAEILHGFSKVITFFMFDRTPEEVVGLAMMILCVYCALQDFGAIMRVAQIMFFVTSSIIMLIFFTSLLTFRAENLLPLRVTDWSGVLKALVNSWGMYSGYELLLLVLPLVYRGEQSLGKSLAGSFAFLMLIFLFVFVLIIGVLTVEGAKNTPYPTVMVVRGVELPGTFVERLENYLLLAWVPVIFDTMAAMMYAVSVVISRFFQYADHRPVALLLGPLLYLTAFFMDGEIGVKKFADVITALGVVFSFGIIPVSLVLTWWRKKEAAHERKDC